MKLPEKRFFFRLDLKLSLVPAVTSGLLLFISHLFTDIPLLYSALTALTCSLLVLMITWLYARNVLRRRLNDLEKIIFDSSKNKLTIPTPDTQVADELDWLIHEAKQTKKAIQDEFERMDRTENYRKEFIGDISHELKTPIFTIQGYLETLLDGALEDRKVNRQFLTKAMKNTERLINLTKDLMEISKLETGELKPVMQLIPLNTVINDVIETLQYKAEQSDIQIHFQQDRSNIFVKADRNQIRQILVNLVENAIKYNKPGGHIYIHTGRDKNKPDKIIVSIKDTGIGIEKNNIKRVTERFFRVDKSRSREQGGTGLGLAIVKHILESHNEELMIKSSPGEGSCFTFRLKSADHHKKN